MKVFISWSGPQSKRFGEIFRDWLPSVLQFVKPYFTPSDIEKGTRWGSEIAQELQSSEVGILCVTRDNLHSDWILFEAGALSKSLDKAHVCPILFGITNADLSGPLKQFQTTEFSRPDVHKLILTINTRPGENKLPPKTLDNVFDKWWPELEQNIQTVLNEERQSNEPIRSERDLLEEILELSRSAAKRILRPASSGNPKAIQELIERFIQLHDEQVSNTGSYQTTLNTMKTMRAALNHILQRYKGITPELDEQFAKFLDLGYIAQPRKQATEPQDEDIPF